MNGFTSLGMNVLYVLDILHINSFIVDQIGQMKPCKI
jgi:hypothetical protein